MTRHELYKNCGDMVSEETKKLYENVAEVSTTEILLTEIILRLSWISAGIDDVHSTVDN